MNKLKSKIDYKTTTQASYDAPPLSAYILDEAGMTATIELPKDFIEAKRIAVLKSDGTKIMLKFNKPPKREKVKLSKTQKAVVVYMRQGYSMMKNVTYVLLEMNLERPSVATFFALLRKRLIKPKGKFLQGRGQVYELSKLGKTAELL